VTRDNGHSSDGHSGVGVLQEPPVDEILSPTATFPSAPGQLPEPATRMKQRARQQIQQNRFVIVAAGAIVAALLIFAVVSMPHKAEPRNVKSHRAAMTDRLNSEGSETGTDKSLFPIIDSGRPNAKDDHQGFLNERDLQRTVTHRAPKPSQTGQTNAAGTLGSIAPFGDQAWQAPPYHPGSSVEVSGPDKAEQEAMEKSSLIYVQKVSAASTSAHAVNGTVAEPGLDLAIGTRLRARLESAASTAVRAPVLAVIEYNYERDGEIVVPAGAKAVGHIRDASRSGYVDIQFDSLLMPDGASVPIEAGATDLDLRPLKGRVEGKDTGKNVLVRSLSGIGQAGSMLIGQGSLNQPLNESDLMRERVSSNIGEAGDEEISRLAMTQHIVVTVSAGVPIYVVLEHAHKENEAPPRSAGQSTPASTSANIEQLRQLLELQQELGQSGGSPSTR
jgi:hypothetical protein